MPVNLEDVMRLLATLSDEANLRVTVKESVKGGVIAGVSTAIGGVLLGPVGLAVGGIFGGLTAAYFGQDKFQPVSSVILSMDADHKRRLYNDARAVIDKLDYTDILTLTTLISSELVFKQQLLGIIMNYLNSNLKMQVLD